MVTVRKRAIVLLLALVPLLGTAAAEGPTEYEVKAAFLYNFAKYVQWPADAPARRTGIFVITVLGRDPFGAAIDRALEGRAVHSLRVVVRRAATPGELEESQIVFISDSERAEVPSILRRLRDTATLTVAEMDQFAERGGAIRFRTDGDRIRLDINPAAAERAGLKLSSELLKLARIVPPPAGG